VSGLICFAIITRGGLSKHDIEAAGSIKYREFLDARKNCYFLKDWWYMELVSCSLIGRFVRDVGTYLLKYATSSFRT
jgi:hypothetical protein